MKTKYLYFPVIFLVLIFFSASAGAYSKDFTVDGRAQPWLTNSSLNSAYDYGANDGTYPLQVGADDGFSFNTNDSLTVEYLFGTVCAWNHTEWCGDADGYKDYNASDTPGSSGNYFPSLYMDDDDYPIYLIALVGTFADSGGTIIGGPFFLGNGPTEVFIPPGADFLQLGVNDDVFRDNRGAFSVEVTGPSGNGCEPVPEPASMLLLGAGLAAFGGRLRLRTKTE